MAEAEKLPPDLEGLIASIEKNNDILIAGSISEVMSKTKSKSATFLVLKAITKYRGEKAAAICKVIADVARYTKSKKMVERLAYAFLEENVRALIDKLPNNPAKVVAECIGKIAPDTEKRPLLLKLVRLCDRYRAGGAVIVASALTGIYSHVREDFKLLRPINVIEDIIDRLLNMRLKESMEKARELRHNVATKARRNTRVWEIEKFLAEN